jgi:pimeloyl-ACP methyl ester carboxylesterase
VAAGRGVHPGCAETAGGLLPNLGTVNVARDMEQIRIALGEQKLNYFGVRWGTYLATVYTTLFPGRMDRMILDM